MLLFFCILSFLFSLDCSDKSSMPLITSNEVDQWYATGKGFKIKIYKAGEVYMKKDLKNLQSKILHLRLEKAQDGSLPVLFVNWGLRRIEVRKKRCCECIVS